MSTPWGTSLYATPTPVIDSVMRAPAPTPAPTPVPIPGMVPLPFPQFMAPLAAASYLGVPPMGFGMSPMGMPPMGFPLAAASYLGMPPMGFHPAQALGIPPVPVPFLGVPPLGVSPAPAPYMGVPPMGFDMQMTPWSIAGLGGHHAIAPVTAMLLQQLGLREAVTRIADAALKQRVTDNINEAIDRTIEGVSGMMLHPSFGPGAQLMIYPIAAQLALIADRYPEGTLKDALLTIAGQIVQKSTSPIGEGAGRQK